MQDLTLNSHDPEFPKIAENIDAAGKFVSAVAGAAKIFATLEAPVYTAQEKTDKYCIMKSESARIERATLP